MSKFNIGDKVMFVDKLCKVIHVYDNGYVKLQSIRGKTRCIYYHIPPDYIQKEDKTNGQI